VSSSAITGKGDVAARSTSQLGTYIAHTTSTASPPNLAQRGPFATAPTQAQEALAHTRNQPLNPHLSPRAHPPPPERQQNLRCR
ncbi:hypothetical protein O988_09558, partial [Pseudogymnoascus sp. VKM F-3808]